MSNYYETAKDILNTLEKDELQDRGYGLYYRKGVISFWERFKKIDIIEDDEIIGVTGTWPVNGIPDFLEEVLEHLGEHLAKRYYYRAKEFLEKISYSSIAFTINRGKRNEQSRELALVNNAIIFHKDHLKVIIFEYGNAETTGKKLSHPACTISPNNILKIAKEVIEVFERKVGFWLESEDGEEEE